MSVQAKFLEMGIRAEIAEPRRGDGKIVVDIDRDANGEFFSIRTSLSIQVLDIDPKDKHLVLMARAEDGTKPKYLCGFDERGWFAAVLPEPQHVRWKRDMMRPSRHRGISDIESAKAALKPAEVVEAEERKKIKKRKRNNRFNAAWRRQGEWFFVPDSKMKIDPTLVLYNEPIRMGNRREHICSELYRSGGETVWVNHENPNGILDKDYKALSAGEKAKGLFRRMTRNATGVYVRGRITASDHAPLYLDGWHKVVPNTENRAVHAKSVAFLD